MVAGIRAVEEMAGTGIKDVLPAEEELASFARRGPPGRVSPVPLQVVTACPPPYPADTLHPSGSYECSLLPSP